MREASLPSQARSKRKPGNEKNITEQTDTVNTMRAEHPRIRPSPTTCPMRSSY